MDEYTRAAVQLLLDHHHCSYTCISFAHLMGPDQTAELTQCAKPSAPCNSLVEAIKPVNQFGTTVQVWILSYPYYGDCSTAVDTMCPQFNSTHDLISAHQHSFTATDCCPLANYHTRVSTASGKLLAPR